ncbi:MerR family transcriptional regulator [Cumulibacter soli]|uniref:MerR family transcriptional regulator n=1 Tax=Cumulibacter soli TaxID=2546344 RepID=UPI00106881C1|nr:MerR family transcriptional regulator [Cumulibacter soli]
MKIGAFAQAGRTTARAIRHYHQLGVLPEPERRSNGYREYQFTDLVRLLRITWLTRAGVPLGKVADILRESDADDRDADGPDAESTVALSRDLTLVAMTIEAERDRLNRQLAALAQIRDAVDERRALSALPTTLSAALDHVADAAEGPQRAVIERDREMLEVLALSGELREEMVRAYAALAEDPVQLAEALRIGADFAAIEGKRVGDVEPEIAALVDAMFAAPAVRAMFVSVDAMGGSDGLDGADGMGGLEIPELPSAEDMVFFVPDPAQREVALRLLRRMS